MKKTVRTRHAKESVLFRPCQRWPHSQWVFCLSFNICALIRSHKRVDNSFASWRANLRREGRRTEAAGCHFLSFCAGHRTNGILFKAWLISRYILFIYFLLKKLLKKIAFNKRVKSRIFSIYCCSNANRSQNEALASHQIKLPAPFLRISFFPLAQIGKRSATIRKTQKPSKNRTNCVLV